MFLFDLGVTVLLSLTVFQDSVSETMPITSLQIPLLGKNHSNPRCCVDSSQVRPPANPTICSGKRFVRHLIRALHGQMFRLNYENKPLCAPRFLC